MGAGYVLLVVVVVLALIAAGLWAARRRAAGRRAELARAALAEADARLDRADRAWTAAEQRPAGEAARLGADGDHDEAAALALRRRARRLAPDVARAELARREVGDPYVAQSDHRGERPADVPPQPPARPRRRVRRAQPVNEGLQPPLPAVAEEMSLPLPSTAEEFTPPGRRRTAGAVDEGPILE